VDPTCPVPQGRRGGEEGATILGWRGSGAALTGRGGRRRCLDEIRQTELTDTRSEGGDLLQKEEGSDGSALAGKMELGRKKSHVGAPSAFDRRERRNGRGGPAQRVTKWRRRGVQSMRRAHERGSRQATVRAQRGWAAGGWHARV
jgi:hypothetical protein